MFRNLSKPCAILVTLFVTVGCGEAFDKLMGKKTGAEETDDYEETEVSFNLSYGGKALKLLPDLSLSNNSFNLVSVSNFTVDITTCASGYTKDDVIAGGTTTTVKMYAKDRGCLAELQSFIYNAKTYVKSGGGNLSTGTAVFENQADAAETLMVGVVAQLPDPLTDAATASFSFREISQGADFAISNYSYTDTVEVQGVAAPNFSISDVVINAINAVTGEATFDIKTQCGRVVTQPSGDYACETSATDSQNFIDMKVKLIYDDSGIYTAHKMTYAQAETAMSAGTTTLTNGMFDGSTANDGFLVSIAGAGQLYTHKDMFFIISYTAANGYGTSYRYFRVTIGDPQ